MCIHTRGNANYCSLFFQLLSFGFNLDFYFGCLFDLVLLKELPQLHCVNTQICPNFKLSSTLKLTTYFIISQSHRCECKCCFLAAFFFSYSPNSEKLHFDEQLLSLSRLYVVLAHCLNPLTIATCVAMTTSVFHNLILATLLLCMLRGWFT